VVFAAVTGRGWLPVVIDGLDTSAMTRETGPVMLPVVAIATVVAVTGAMRLTGPVRWAALAAAAALSDLVLTLFSFHRYSLGWYAGRSLTVVSCAVVLVAMLAEFSRLKGQLAVEGDRLRSLLSRTQELEGLQSTLLNLMTDGVMLHGGDGQVVVANPAAETLMGLSADQLHRRAPMPAGWNMVRSDGSQCPVEERPSMVTLVTGVAQRDQLIGLPVPGGGLRCLRVSTSAERAGERLPLSCSTCWPPGPWPRTGSCWS
jgi:PAS domain-containing protein